MTPFTIKITPAGRLHFIYHDALRLLLIAGESQIRRASHVEPTAEGHWTADLTPIDGPMLGPFVTRAEALVAEIDWITQHWLHRPTHR